MNQHTIRLLIAAESPTDGDAVCQFLRAQDHMEVAAEVRDGQYFVESLHRTKADVLVLNRLLPGADQPDKLLRAALAVMPPAHVVYISPGHAALRPKVAALTRQGVHTLTGGFGAETLLEAVARAYRPPRTLHFCSVRPGLGVTTLCLALAHLASRGGERVHLCDASPRHDLLALPHIPRGMEAPVAGAPEGEWGLTMADWGTRIPSAQKDVYVLMDDSFTSLRLYKESAEVLPSHTVIHRSGSKEPPRGALQLPHLKHPPLMGASPLWSRRQLAPLVPLARQLDVLGGNSDREYAEPQRTFPLFQRRPSTGS